MLKRKRETLESCNKKLRVDVREKIIHPFVIFCTGTCGSGKTTTITELIQTHIAPQMDRMIFIVPSYFTQPIFRQFDDYINIETDVITDPTREVLGAVLKQIEKVNKAFVLKGKQAIKTFLFMDDLTGTSLIHGGRMGILCEFAAQYRHHDCSVCLITHQATSATPTLRDNALFIIAFPSNRKKDQDWIVEEYKCPSYDNETVKKIILSAWRGGRKDDKEMGKHFVFIWQKQRDVIRYYCDFDFEINVKNKHKKTKHEKKRLRLK